MSSFYGNNTVMTGGITPVEVEMKVADVKNHIIFSKDQPTTQKANDVWVIIKEYTDNNNSLSQNE